jgi:hypothetical protein
MKRLIGIILIIVGAYLFFMGVSRRNSFAGRVDTATANVSNSVDASGGTSTPTHVFYMIGGGVLVVIGAVTALGRASKV